MLILNPMQFTVHIPFLSDGRLWHTGFALMRVEHMVARVK
jgi:hypothetical protein